MAQSKVRVVGSGYTVMTFRGQRLAYLATINERAPRPVKAAEQIQPIDEEHPIEIVTAQAVTGGSMTLQFYELWNAPVWAALPGFEGTNSIIDVLKRQLTLGEITCQKIIKNPTGAYRTRVYHGCVLTEIDESESVNIQAISVPKTVTIEFTHTTTV